MASKLTFPVVRRAATTYVKHGITIADPYQWLEDPASDETKQFVTDQNKYFESAIAPYPNRQALFDRISKLHTYAKTSGLSQRNGQFYYYHNKGLQNQSVWYRLDGVADDKANASVFIDANLLSADGTTALGTTGWSKSEGLVAYTLREKGSDWGTIFVMDSKTKVVLEDKVTMVKNSGISWVGDAGFFYTKYPVDESQTKDAGAETTKNEKPFVRFHRIGTKEEEDVTVFSVPEHPGWSVGAEVSDDHKYVMFHMSEGCDPRNRLWLSPIPESFGTAPSAEALVLTKLIDEFQGSYDYLFNEGPVLYFATTHKTPRKSIISIDISKPVVETVVVPEKESVLSFCGVARDQLLLVYMEDVKHVCYMRPLHGGETRKLDLPIAAVTSMYCSPFKSFVAISVTSFLLPGRTLYFDVEKPDAIKIFSDDVPQGFDPEKFETKQVFYDSEGGVRVPMFLVHRKGLVLDGNNPTILYGYGGFNISITPWYSTSRVVWFENLGGVLAVANIRGGSEYGQAWYEGGKNETKQNCFTDFINAMKWLHANKYTNPQKLAIQGGSNGGLLVAVCANQAPDQFRVGVAQVPVTDGLRFDQFTVGHYWRSDFGNPSVEEDFRRALKWSPLHNIRTNTHYPAVLCCTGDHDDRVVPLHTHKYLASLQHANPEAGGPFVGRIEVATGHGAGKPTTLQLKEVSDTIGFVALMLDAPWFPSTSAE